MVFGGPWWSLNVFDGSSRYLMAPDKSIQVPLRKAMRLRTRDNNYLNLLKALCERGVSVHDVPWKGNCGVFTQQALSMQMPLPFRENYQEKAGVVSYHTFL